MADQKMIVKCLEDNTFWTFDILDDETVPDGWAKETEIQEAGKTSESWYFDEYNWSGEGECAAWEAKFIEGGFTKQN